MRALIPLQLLLVLLQYVTLITNAHQQLLQCKDKPNYLLNKKKHKNCKWISDPKRFVKQCAKPGPQKHCRLSCGICCSDTNISQCSALTPKYKRCQEPSTAILCPKTCGVCCFDDTEYTYPTKKGADKKCAWMVGKTKRIRKHCKGVTKSKCGETCGKEGCIVTKVEDDDDDDDDGPSPPAPPVRELTFPPIIDNAVNGVLDMDLAHRYADFEGDMFRMTNARLLNGILPGPTIKVNAGDTLRILYKNEMTDQKLPETAENAYGYMDHTNLHFHGGHVSGELPSDDVRLKIPPGDSYQYQTTFPTTHMPGTHWVHPHVHGSSALQVSNGAALALIVKDPPNYLPSIIEQAKEVLMVLMDIDLERTKKVADAMKDGKFGYGPGRDGKDYKHRLVNGQYKPEVSARPNEWMRWRVIYAGHNHHPMDVRIRDKRCEMVLLAKDGIYIQDFPRPITVAPIPTSGRADLMVRCTTPGTYSVTTFSDDDSSPTLTIKISGTALPSTSLPTWTPEYPPYLHNLLTATVEPACTCDSQFSKCGDNPYLGCINNLPFHANKSIHSIELGKVVERRSNPQEHMYHQHVYPFQFQRYSKVDQPRIATEVKEYFKFGDWHDVIQMVGLEGNVEMRFHPREHLGLLMVHCHRLTHEDRGMMAWENVYDEGKLTCDCDIRDEIPLPIL